MRRRFSPVDSKTISAACTASHWAASNELKEEAMLMLISSNYLYTYIDKFTFISLPSSSMFLVVCVWAFEVSVDFWINELQNVESSPTWWAPASTTGRLPRKDSIPGWSSSRCAVSRPIRPTSAEGSSYRSASSYLPHIASGERDGIIYMTSANFWNLDTLC